MTPALPIGVMCGPVQGLEDGAPREALAFASRAGFDGVLFATPRSVSPALDASELADTRQRAAELGLYLETGIGCLGPFGDPQERLAELETQIGASLALGCDSFFAYTRSERRHATVSHADQLATIEATLRALVPLLRDQGARLNLKTHEDLSSHEVLRLVDAAGPDVVGVSLDVANLVVRSEDPVAATRRLAPYVHQTHLEDVALFFVEDGLRRRLRPCGAGILDWSAILAVLVASSPTRHLTLEQHRGRFDADVFEPAWFDTEPHASARELGVLVHAAYECELRAARGAGPSLLDLEVEPPAAVRRAELVESAAHLRSILDTITGGHHGSDR
jgi:sugar phosphate isomerase/epimerase